MTGTGTTGTGTTGSGTAGMPPRRVLLVTHTGRPAATASAAHLVARLQRAGIDVVADGGEATDLAFSGEGGVVKVEISCGGRHESCRVLLA